MRKRDYVNSARTVGYRYKLNLWNRFPRGVMESPFADTKNSGLQQALDSIA